MTRKILLISVVAIGLLLIASAIPTSNDSVDVIVDVTIKNPYGAAPFIETHRVEIVPTTLFSINSIAGILYSDNLKLTLRGGGTSTTKEIAKIWETNTDTYQIVLKDVPKTTRTLTLELYESSKKVDTQEIRL